MKGSAGMRRRRSAIPFAALAWALCFSCFKVLSPTSFIAPPKSRPALESSAGLAVAAAGAAFEAGTSPAMAQQETFAFVGKSSADLFPLSNLSILTWLLLIVAPGWEYTKSAALVAPVINAVMYVIVVAFLITHPPPDAPAVDFGSLSSIVTAFQNPDGVFAGWLHYCVFDPLVGLGEVLDSQQNKVPHALVVPCLILTLLLGPMGFLLYLAVRSVTLASRPAASEA
mmetsp:Transcript_27373/g.64343  ORF Transcript_27373/g.64343 Transcript_27373/m.64343 type:complete len:227 (+) Transcript_27373:51-731(+)